MRRLLLVFAACLFALPSLRAEDADKIKARLDAAKKAYYVESKELNEEFIAEFDRRERIARKDGNKELVAVMKEERRAFELDGEYPLTISQPLTEKLTAVRGRMDTAYKAAMKEYLTANLDGQADATEKEMKAYWQGM